MKVAGADVWKKKWIVVVLADGHFDRAFVAVTFEGVLEAVPDAVAVGVDIPIGLPAPGQRRPADVEARKLVGPSVFMTASRDLLEAETYRKANELAKADGRKGISAQEYALGNLILKVDPVAARDSRVYEVHPEVSFRTANNDTRLLNPKASWNGIHLRRRILKTHDIVIPDDLGSGGDAGIADVLDAAIAAWSANRIATGQAEPRGADRIGTIWR